MINKSTSKSDTEPNNNHLPAAHGAAPHKQDHNQVNNNWDADPIREEQAWYLTKYLRQGIASRSHSWPELPMHLQNKLEVPNVSDKDCNHVQLFLRLLQHLLVMCLDNQEIAEIENITKISTFAPNNITRYI